MNNNLTALEKVEQIVKAADDRRASNILALDVHELTPIADYFVIMDASNDRLLDAIVQAITDKAHEVGFDYKSIEGKSGGRWILIDFYDVIVHVFYYSERSHYNLENIWKEAPLVDISEWISED